MSAPQERTPEERRAEWNTALAGVFRAYSLRASFPDIVQTQIRFRSGQRQSFWVFGAFGEEAEIYKPEVLVIFSEDKRIRIAARAVWNDDWPQVRDTYATFSIGKDMLSSAELLEVVNKVSLALRFTAEA